MEVETETARRVWVLLRGLPPESLTWRQGTWTLRDELMARTVENIDYWGWVAACQHGGGDIVPRPEPFWHPDRPGSEPPAATPKVNDPQVIARFFAQHMNPN